MESCDMESYDYFQTIAGIRLPVQYQDKFHQALLDFLNERWYRVLPSPLSEHSGAMALLQEDGYVLIVAAQHSIWLNEIEWHKGAMLNAIAQLLDGAIIRIKDIAFRVDPHLPQPFYKPDFGNNSEETKNTSQEANDKDKHLASQKVSSHSLMEQIEQKVKDDTLRDILTKMSRHIEKD